MINVTVALNYMNIFAKKFWKEKVLIIALILSICSSVITRPKLSYIDFKVLVLLFNLMIIVAAFKKLKVLDIIAMVILSKCNNTRMVSAVFILMTFFSSMIVTNDVALITFVPLAIITFKVGKVDCMKTVIIQTLAANIGSSLTPMGNPQNLFLFTHYNLSAMKFFIVTIPFVVLGLLWLLFINRRVRSKTIKINLKAVNFKKRKSAIVYLILFIFVITSVFGLVNYIYTLVVVVLFILIMDFHLFKDVDYFLLATFVCFFIFIGNISNITIIQTYLKSILKLQHMPYFSSIILSQVISNVPCSILIAGFTDNWKEVLLGANVGGMGTIIASLASLISYKIYIKEIPQSSRIYLKKFNLYNFSSLFIFTILMYVSIIF